MKTMRQYINLINEAFAAFKPKNEHTIARIAADTDENRKHVETIKQYEKEIEDDINAKFDVSTGVRRTPPVDSDEWDEEHMWLKWELHKRRKEEAHKKEVQRMKAQQ
jgi:hypothetical protein